MEMAILATLSGQNNLDLLNNSFTLLQDTVASWDELWNEVFQPTHPLWASINNFALMLAGLAFLYTAIKEASQILQEASWSKVASMLIVPLAIVIFLGGGGNLGAQSVKIVRTIGFNQVSNMMEQQVGGQTFQVAMETIKTESVAGDILRQIYAECEALPDLERIECQHDPQKAQHAQEVMDTMGFDMPNNMGELFELFDPVGAAIGVLMVILYGVQWAFINCTEAALLMTGLLFPIAFGLSILPIAIKPLYAWFTAMIALFSVQMSYNIVVGLVATVSLNAAGNNGFMQSGQDLAFAVFLSFFSPMLSVALGAGGGLAIFRQGQSAIRGAIAGTTSAVNTGLLGVLAWKKAHANAGTASAPQVTAANNTPSASSAPAAPSNNNLRALPQSKA
ncbi:MAG: hypothetical protein AAGD25_15190 [Cyanobacteria bacterium P01_F01_bin.150]